jgi:hypothetical protein
MEITSKKPDVASSNPKKKIKKLFVHNKNDNVIEKITTGNVNLNNFPKFPGLYTKQTPTLS